MERIQKKINKKEVPIFSKTARYLKLYYVYLLVFMTPLLVLADADKFHSPIGEMTFEEFALKVLTIVMYVLFPFVVLMIVYTGFLFIKAQGNESKLSEARTALLWTVIGGMVLLGAYALSGAVKETIESVTGTIF